MRILVIDYRDERFDTVREAIGKEATVHCVRYAITETASSQGWSVDEWEEKDHELSTKLCQDQDVILLHCGDNQGEARHLLTGLLKERTVLGFTGKGARPIWWKPAKHHMCRTRVSDWKLNHRDALLGTLLALKEGQWSDAQKAFIGYSDEEEKRLQALQITKGD